MRTAEHVYGDGNGTYLECDYCKFVFKQLNQYPNVDGREECPKCGEELLYKGWAEW